MRNEFAGEAEMTRATIRSGLPGGRHGERPVRTRVGGLAPLASAAQWGLCALLLWAPIPLGSNRPLFWAINALAAAAILLAFAAGEWARTRRDAFDWPVALAGIGALAALGLWIGWQSLPFAPAGLSHPLWQSLEGGPAPLLAPASLNPLAGWTALIVCLTLAVTLVAARMGAEPRAARRLLACVLGGALVPALYGLALALRDSPLLFWMDKWAYRDVLSGTFVNPNTAATLLGFGLVAALALTLARLETMARGPARRRAARPLLAGELMGPLGLLLALMAVLAAALAQTGSRAGTAASLLAIVAVLALNAGRPGGGRAVAWAAGLAAVAGASLVAALGARGVAEAARALASDTEIRLSLYRDTLAAIDERPLTGHGAGTFADLYPLYRGPGTAPGEVWLHAHNAYLDLAVTLGLPAAVMIVLAAAVGAGLCMRAARAAPRPPAAALAASGMAVLAGAHALFDYSVQVQAVSLAFWCTFAAGLAEARALRAQSARDARAEGMARAARLTPSRRFAAAEEVAAPSPRPHLAMKKMRIG